MQPKSQDATVVDQTQFYILSQSLTSARSTYDELLQRLNQVGHRIEDTNLPQVANDVKKMKESPRPGVYADLTNETDLIHQKNDWLREIVNKLEKLF